MTTIELESQLYSLGPKIWEIGYYDADKKWYPSAQKMLREGARCGNYEVVWKHCSLPAPGEYHQPMGALILRYLDGDVRPWSKPWDKWENIGKWNHKMKEITYDEYVKNGLKI